MHVRCYGGLVKQTLSVGLEAFVLPRLAFLRVGLDYEKRSFQTLVKTEFVYWSFYK